MTTSASGFLVLNAGSSSLKYQLLQPDTGYRSAGGIVERIGAQDARIEHTQGDQTYTRTLEIPDHKQALGLAVELFAEAGTHLADEVKGVGHRVVHGGRQFSDPVIVDDAVIEGIRAMSHLAPLHNPVNIAGIEAIRQLLPGVPNVAVFDTAFFHDLPAAAATYAIDADVAQRYDIRRYGFHGTSHDYVSAAAAEFLRTSRGELNLIVLHLGNGASASAIRGGRAIDTTMGMTPLEGLVMGTRSGDIDPAIAAYLGRVAGMDADAVDAMLNSSSGLKGLCGENDFRTIDAMIERGENSAKLAYDVYIHRLRRYIGAYLVDLGHVDAIVFTAGIGENAANVRADALAGLTGFGIEVDAQANATRSSQARAISTATSAVHVLVVPTDEEHAIAKAAADLIGD